MIERRLLRHLEVTKSVFSKFQQSLAAGFKSKLTEQQLVYEKAEESVSDLLD